MKCIIWALLISFALCEVSYKNADEIYTFFKNKGWTVESISGMLGNMQWESGGVWPDIKEMGGNGYGLAQWTPGTKLRDWANANGLNYRTVNTQCRRIIWELENSQQYYPSAFPMSFKQFTQSKQSPEYLAEVFMRNYERPDLSVAHLSERKQYARNWYNRYKDGSSSSTQTSTTTPTSSVSKWFSSVTGYNPSDGANGYAGLFGTPITGLAVSGGTSYRVHIKGKGWQSAVTGYNINDFNNGYAGDGNAIDGIAIKGATYRVHIMKNGGQWLSAVTGYDINDENNGYAGILGYAIDAVAIKGRTYRSGYSG